MGKVKAVSLILLIPLSIPLFYLFFVFLLGIFKGYQWSEMDWNRNGTTSFSEILMAADTDTRPVKFRSMDCIEIFHFKDGLTLKAKCGNSEIDPMYFREIDR